MGEFSRLSHRRGIPNFDLGVGGACQDSALVQMTPLDAVYFSAMSLHNLDWTLLRRGDIPKSNTSIATSAQKLVLICFIKANVERGVRSFHLSDYIDASLVHIEQ